MVARRAKDIDRKIWRDFVMEVESLDSLRG